jgi:DNA-binding NtrC family response regulator
VLISQKVIMKKVILSINKLTAMNFLVQTVLSPKHTVVSVRDVMAGMQILKNRGSVDFIIMDGETDSAENREFVYHVKNSRMYSDCRIISLGTPVNNVGEQNVEEYFDRIFKKPFSPEQLIEYVNGLSQTEATKTYQQTLS